MKRLTAFLITAVMCLTLSSCGEGKKTAVAVSSASIDYGVSSYAYFTEDASVIEELAEFYNTLKLKKTDTQLDIASAYRVCIGDKSFWLDENNTVWLNGSTVNYTLTSGRASYERIAEIYESGKRALLPSYPAPDLSVISSNDNSVSYSGSFDDLNAYADLLTSAGWDKYEAYNSFAFYKDSVILRVSPNMDGTSFSVTSIAGALSHEGRLTEEDAKRNIGESRSFTVELYVPGLYEKLKAQLFYTVLPDLTVKQNLMTAGHTLEIPFYAHLFSVADTDDDGEYEFVCAGPDPLISILSYIFNTYTVKDAIEPDRTGRYAPDTLTPLALTDDGSGTLLLLLSDAHGETVKRTVSFLNDKIIVQ